MTRAKTYIRSIQSLWKKSLRRFEACCNFFLICRSREPQKVVFSGMEHPRLKNPLVWVDLEMTGLDVEKDQIIEIAVLLSDGDLTQIVEVC